MTTRRELLAAFAGTNARFLRHRRGADNRAENHRRDTRGEKARYVSGLNPWAPLWGLSVREGLKEAATPELLDSCSLEPSRVPWENQCRFPDPGVALRIGHLADFSSTILNLSRKCPTWSDLQRINPRVEAQLVFRLCDRECCLNRCPFHWRRSPLSPSSSPENIDAHRELRVTTVPWALRSGEGRAWRPLDRHSTW